MFCIVLKISIFLVEGVLEMGVIWQLGARYNQIAVVQLRSDTSWFSSGAV